MRKQSLTLRVRSVIHVLSAAALAGAVVACDKAPTASSPAPAQPAPQSAPVTITAISDTTGSTGGGASIAVSGTGFTPIMSVTFGGSSVRATFDSRYTSPMFVQTPAHSAGVVDVVVINSDGQSARLIGAYTFVSPDSFDLNGVWNGGTYDGSDRGMRFTIQNNTLTSVSCFGDIGDSSPLTLSSPAPVSNGAFALVGGDGVSISGRIVSADEVIGTMTTPGCTNMDWRAFRGKPAAQDLALR